VAGRSIVRVRAAAPSADPAGVLAGPSGSRARAAGLAAASPGKRADSRLGRRAVSKAEARGIAGACRAGRLIKASRVAADIIAWVAATGVAGAGTTAGAGVVNGAGNKGAR
jgi:hypothetical protein